MESIQANFAVGHLQNIAGIAPRFDRLPQFRRRTVGGNLSSYKAWFLVIGTTLAKNS